MRKVWLSSFLFVAIVSAGATTVTITAGPFSSVSGAATSTFDMGLQASYATTGALAGIRTGSVKNVYLTPTGDGTPYAYVSPNSSITETLATGTTYLGLYWGSPDSYNSLSFTDSNGVTTVYGQGGTPVPGLVLDQMTSVYVNFFDSGAAWTSVTWTTGGPAFEFDNVATAAVAPEPPSIILLAISLLAIGAGAIRQRRTAQVTVQNTARARRTFFVKY